MKISRFTEVVIGALMVIVAAVLGSYLTAKYSHDFQSKLLERQIVAQKELFEDQMKFQETLLKAQQKYEKDSLRRNERIKIETRRMYGK